MWLQAWCQDVPRCNRTRPSSEAWRVLGISIIYFLQLIVCGGNRIPEMSFNIKLIKNICECFIVIFAVPGKWKGWFLKQRAHLLRAAYVIIPWHHSGNSIWNLTKTLHSSCLGGVSVYIATTTLLSLCKWLWGFVSYRVIYKFVDGKWCYINNLKGLHIVR